MSRATGRFSRWMDRIIDADERYICAACDDRFPGRHEGISHVLACHPEFAGMLTTEAVDQAPVIEPVAARPLGATRPFAPALS
jgi:hypothetical protein